MKTKGKKAAAKKSDAGKKSAKAAVATAAAVAETIAPPPPVAAAPAHEAPAVIDEDLKAPAASERRPISIEERRRLIALTAYRRAETHGLGTTDPVEDWLVAEREIDAMLVGGVHI
ncbi:DUF2934 domain-containing protein [Polyangium sorediatum]|uniref:DUF2934 domain-containing protein n=1 Tax=Polyangium sorediatum TaxID=889274 RepID=A0ABT6P373_9BACT|nr:DUF2934 domain-containing protein [Polyangium sorediatum]MDI1434971.1 DUF2934 domain-containing protein [Polyangium sorediatum]